MISRKNRFHGHNSLRTVYSRGKAVRGPSFAIKFVANDRRKDYRLAVVVSKKVNKSAVKRNRIRRQVYEIVRSQKLITGNYDVVLTVFSDQLGQTSTSQLENELRDHFRQAGLV